MKKKNPAELTVAYLSEISEITKTKKIKKKIENLNLLYSGLSLDFINNKEAIKAIKGI